jgi:hypothetical protein
MVRKVKLIDEWKSAWRFASVQIQAAGLVIMGVSQALGETWNQMPPNLQQLLPHANTIAMVLFGLGLIGRILTKREAPANAKQ